VVRIEAAGPLATSEPDLQPGVAKSFGTKSGQKSRTLRMQQRLAEHWRAAKSATTF
jgi:hypothetical protein